jgi:hypothetical protein
MLQPFVIAIPDERLAVIQSKVTAFDWERMPDAGGWSSGVGLTDLRRLTDYWLREFDWRAQEARLNRLPHFMADVLDEQVHFVRAAMVRGRHCSCFMAGLARSWNLTR